MKQGASAGGTGEVAVAHACWAVSSPMMNEVRVKGAIDYGGGISSLSDAGQKSGAEQRWLHAATGGPQPVRNMARFISWGSAGGESPLTMSGPFVRPSTISATAARFNQRSFVVPLVSHRRRNAKRRAVVLPFGRQRRAVFNGCHENEWYVLVSSRRARRNRRSSKTASRLY